MIKPTNCLQKKIKTFLSKELRPNAFNLEFKLLIYLYLLTDFLEVDLPVHLLKPLPGFQLLTFLAGISFVTKDPAAANPSSPTTLPGSTTAPAPSLPPFFIVIPLNFPNLSFDLAA